MFGSTIELAEKYDYLSEKFKLAYEFLRRPDLEVLPESTITLGQGVIAHVQHYVTSASEMLKFETHKKYFDVQYIVSGIEAFQVADFSVMDVDEEYNPVKDITYYKEPDYYGTLVLKPGNFIIVSPEEAHKPRCNAGHPIAVIKIVIKVPV